MANSEPSTQIPIYVNYLKKGDDESSVWYYFLREKDGQSGKCKNGDCQQIIKTSGGTTSSLR